jgi:class 3 adenylate cyclase
VLQTAWGYFWKHRLPVGLAIGWVSLTTGLYFTGVFSGLEARAYDWLVRHRRVESPPVRLLLIDFDDESQARLGWPIPRRVVAQIIEAASPHAKLIGLDILLSEARNPAEDSRLAKAIRRAGNVILVEQLPSNNIPAAYPLDSFREVAFDVGFANLPLDNDAVVRRSFLFLLDGSQVQESFPLRLAANWLESQLQPTTERHGYLLGSNLIQADPSEPNVIWISFYGPASTFAKVPAWQVLETSSDFSLAADIILIGQSNLASRDLHTTPYFSPASKGIPQLTSGVELQATVVANLLSGKTIQPLSRGAIALIDLITVVGVLACFIAVRPLLALLLSGGWSAGLTTGALWVLSAHDTWLPFAHSLALVAATGAAAWGYRYSQERHTRLQLMSLFARYVSPQVASKIWAHREQIVLAGERRTATVLFCDIRDYTQITYQRPSTEVMQWLNEYFTAMVPAILSHNGFVNKFMGDGLMALFGVPVSRGEPEDARDAVAAALQMIDTLDKLNRRRSTAGLPPLRIGIGVHTGPLTAGTIGAMERSEYTVVGETVNLAARVETACRQFDQILLVTEATAKLLGDGFWTRPVGSAQLKGFADPVLLYNVARTPRLEERP